MEPLAPLPSPTLDPWLDPHESAAHAKTGVRGIYDAVRTGRLKAARINGRREIRCRRSWVDQWLEAAAEPVEITVQTNARRDAARAGV